MNYWCGAWVWGYLRSELQYHWYRCSDSLNIGLHLACHLSVEMPFWCPANKLSLSVWLTGTDVIQWWPGLTYVLLAFCVQWKYSPRLLLDNLTEHRKTKHWKCHHSFLLSAHPHHDLKAPSSSSPSLISIWDMQCRNNIGMNTYCSTTYSDIITNTTLMNV